MPTKPIGKKYYALVDGVETGPFTYEMLKVEINVGRIQKDTLCAAPGDQEWKPFCQITNRD